MSFKFKVKFFICLFLKQKFQFDFRIYMLQRKFVYFDAIVRECELMLNYKVNTQLYTKYIQDNNKVQFILLSVRIK